MNANTLFLRLEGAFQAWGDQESKFVVRRTAEAPTKSGVIGMLCAALGISRSQAAEEWLPKLSELSMGVRIDNPGVRWWDYHTVGAMMRKCAAQGGVRRDPKGGIDFNAILSRREYLCDASFLVALQGESNLIGELDIAIRNPKWTLYLGRKCCVSTRPLLEHPGGDFTNLLSALASVLWRKRMKGDTPPEFVDCLLDWEPTPEQPEAPRDALVWYDVPLSFEPPAHSPRFVIRHQLRVGEGAEVSIADEPAQTFTPRPPRPRADYGNTQYQKIRQERLQNDKHLCVFCKSPATTVQHVTYRHAGGDERKEELRSLCRLCHDAVTMIEYGLGMGLDRINPEEEGWRDQIIKKRAEIIKFRSLETRRRKLAAEEVE